MLKSLVEQTMGVVVCGVVPVARTVVFAVIHGIAVVASAPVYVAENPNKIESKIKPTK